MPEAVTRRRAVELLGKREALIEMLEHVRAQLVAVEQQLDTVDVKSVEHLFKARY